MAKHTKVKLFTYNQSAGDGSWFVLYFSTQEKMEEYADLYEESMFYEGGEFRTEWFEIIDGVLTPIQGFHGDECLVELQAAKTDEEE